jgi:hypothetical protein
MTVPDVIPQVVLSGSQDDKLKTLDACIVQLQEIPMTLAGGRPAPAPQPELHGPHINAPVWPWFAAGCGAGAGFVLLLLFAWLSS